MSRDEWTLVNDARRRAQAPSGSARERYRLEPHESQLRADLDLAGINRLADVLEDEATLLRLRGGPSAEHHKDLRDSSASPRVPKKLGPGDLA